PVHRVCLTTLVSTPTLDFLFYNDPATSELSTLSLHDALPISSWAWERVPSFPTGPSFPAGRSRTVKVKDEIKQNEGGFHVMRARSEEHTSELQSLTNLVCRLLLEKKKHPQLLRGLYLLLQTYC